MVYVIYDFLAIMAGLVLALIYFNIRDYIYTLKERRKPKVVYVSNKLNQPGLIIPVRSVHDTIKWVDEP